MIGHAHTLGAISVGVLATACANAPEGPRDAVEAVKEANERIPIHALATTAEQRERMREQGLPVMRVEGQPEYLYWDSRRMGQYNFGWKTTPARQIKRDIHGCVVVSYGIRADGKTEAFEIKHSAPSGVFDQAALQAALVTEYEPSSEARPRQKRAIWFLVARPRRDESSRLNDSIEADRNAWRETQRARCEEQRS